MERVSLISGKTPVILVAPHGYQDDDEKTALIAETIAKTINGYALINRGWERSDKVDYLKDQADCNQVNQCLEDVVREEFLEPLIRFKNRILMKHKEVFIFFIHGMSDKHRLLALDPNLDVVIGYGAGSPHSYSCEPWKKDLLIALINKEGGMTAYEGSKGGRMSGWARSNMNQLFRKWYLDKRVQSMQIEIIHELRSDEDGAILVGMELAKCIQTLIGAERYTSVKPNKSY